MIESGLHRADYIFCLRNYDRMKITAEREAALKRDRQSRRQHAID